jgi:hypothetical protein
MSVKVFKLINGEDLIGEVSIEYTDYIVLNSPAQIVLQQTQQGVGVGLAPYMPFVEGDLKILKTAIAAEGIPKLEMSNEYSRIFGSGIQIATAGSVPGL